MLLAALGAGALLAALALAGFAAIVSGWAGHARLPLLARVGRRSLYASALAVLFAAAILVAAFISHDFVIAYVAVHSDSATPLPLLVSGLYSGQEGSLLYWTLILTGAGALSLAGQGYGRLPAYATAVLALLATFFLVVLVFVAGPFTTLGFVPADGAGLNPLLRDGGMLVHPPFLLAGFASFAVPFSFAAASLLAGESDPGWILVTRRLALLAWGLQGVGLTLGMWWAYHVLGWGGYWGWDPVENVALLPWLVSTAYIHSSQMQERRGMFKAWNFGLVILAFLLAVFGTFVVRSGVVQSVHTFAVSAVGPWFLGFLAVAAVLSLALLAVRAPLLRSDRPVENPVSREGAFLLQNLLFAGAAFAVLWGTVLPLTSPYFSRGVQVVSVPYYERTVGPIFLAILALLAIGPLLPWRGAGSTWLRAARAPGIALVAALAALLGAGVTDWRALVAFPILAAAAATSVLEFIRGGRFATRLPGPWPSAAVRLVARNRRRYAAYAAHIGMVMAACGFAGSHLWQVERQAVLAPGQSVTAGRWTLTLLGTSSSTSGDVTRSAARLAVSGGGEVVPSRSVFASFGGQAASGVAIVSTPVDDLYVVLAESAPDHATLLVFDNPLVGWIWAGAGLVILATLAGSWPARRRPQAVAAGEPVRRPLRPKPARTPAAGGSDA